MDSKELLLRISSIEEGLDKLKNAVYAMKMTDQCKYPANYEELSTDAALRSERITCQLRNLIYASGIIPKTAYLDQAEKAQGIQIQLADSIFIIRLPGLLPKRKVHTNTAFLNEPLHYALKAYTEKNVLPVYDSCVVCFVQVYNEKLPLRRIRDYDNLEFKQILDTISPFVLRDDSGLYCDAFHTTKLGTSDYTLLYIMEKSGFPGWLQTRKTEFSDISDFPAGFSSGSRHG